MSNEKPINYIPTDYETITVLVPQKLADRIKALVDKTVYTPEYVAVRSLELGVRTCERDAGVL